MTIDLDRQIEYAERLYQTGKRRLENPDRYLREFKTKLSMRLLRRMEKDLRTIEAIIETLKARRP